MPETRVRVLVSSEATATRSSSGARHARIACASLGPTPDAVCTSSKQTFSSSSRNPKIVNESSRTTMLVGRVAVASDDTKTLTRVSGIGQKGAQRIILELKDRLGAPVGHVRAGTPAGAPAPWKDQVLQALVGLGWSAKEADAAVEAVAPEAGDDPQVSTLLRSALRTLSKA